MKISEIQQMPRVLVGHHESLFRSYQILERVKSFLKWKVPGKVILELIEEMEFPTERPESP